MAHTTASLDNAQQSPAAGLILREQDPLNLESPQSALRAWITPADQFYVRSHFAEPDLDRSAWRLTVEGAVSEPGDFSFSDLTAMAAESQVAVMECAGNGRVFLTPKAEGTQWQVGAAGNAEYTGVPLAALLARVGVLPTAVDAIFEGADCGQITDAPASRDGAVVSTGRAARLRSGSPGDAGPGRGDDQQSHTQPGLIVGTPRLCHPNRPARRGERDMRYRGARRTREPRLAPQRRSDRPLPPIRRPPAGAVRVSRHGTGRSHGERRRLRGGVRGASRTAHTRTRTLACSESRHGLRFRRWRPRCEPSRRPLGTNPPASPRPV